MTMLMPERMRDLVIMKDLTDICKLIKKYLLGRRIAGLHKDGHEIPPKFLSRIYPRWKKIFYRIARDVSKENDAEEALQKAREEKLELQKVRTRIATDLR